MLSGPSRRTALGAIVPLVLAAAVAAGGGVAGASEGVASAATVKVQLKEWTLTPSAVAVPAGAVTFVVRNAGGIPHEFVIMRTNAHHHVLPMHGSQAAEQGVQGEIEDLAPGKTSRLTVRLQPGKYVLLCNLPGHYKAGQFAALRVR